MRRLSGLFATGLLATALPAMLHAQSDSLRSARLTALGRLFGVVKYFHAAFLERDVPWDSAVAVAVETVSAAKSTDEYGSATRLRRPAASPLVTSSCEWMAKRPPRGRSKRCSLRRDRVVESIPGVTSSITSLDRPPDARTSTETDRWRAPALLSIRARWQSAPCSRVP